MKPIDFHLEKLAEALWRAWVCKHGGDVNIPWEAVATKSDWRDLAAKAIADI